MTKPISSPAPSPVKLTAGRRQNERGGVSSPPECARSLDFELWSESRRDNDKKEEPNDRCRVSEGTALIALTPGGEKDPAQGGKLIPRYAVAVPLPCRCRVVAVPSPCCHRGASSFSWPCLGVVSRQPRWGRATAVSWSDRSGGGC